jgi:aryl-alcohol dehydrogenase-like predicted oxidoreductase
MSETNQRHETLGRSGVRVSPLCLGTMMFGGATNEAEARTIIDDAADHGINFIDTADIYTGGESERIAGRAIAARRDRWVLATKVGNTVGPGPNDGGLSRRRVLHAVEQSLARLGTDYIDIYYLHRPDAATPLEETLRALGDLVAQGKIRYYGLSNFRAWQVAEAAHLARALGIPGPVVSQPYYNAANRMPEVEHLPACAHHGLGVVPFSPLARGVLTGKYQPGVAPDPQSRIGRQDGRALQTEWRPETLVLAQTVAEEAAQRGISTAEFAFAWVLNNRLVTSVIGGPRTLEQWQGYRKALEYVFTAEDEALFDRLVPPGHPSTPGYTDPAFPVTGRIPRG